MNDVIRQIKNDLIDLNVNSEIYSNDISEIYNSISELDQQFKWLNQQDDNLKIMCHFRRLEQNCISKIITFLPTSEMLKLRLINRSFNYFINISIPEKLILIKKEIEENNKLAAQKQLQFQQLLKEDQNEATHWRTLFDDVYFVILDIEDEKCFQQINRLLTQKGKLEIFELFANVFSGQKFVPPKPSKLKDEQNEQKQQYLNQLKKFFLEFDLNKAKSLIINEEQKKSLDQIDFKKLNLTSKTAQYLKHLSKLCGHKYYKNYLDLSITQNKSKKLQFQSEKLSKIMKL